jgi:replicative DNA helicase
VEGPIKDLLEAIRDPRHPPDRVRAFARRVAETLSGHGSARFLVDAGELVRIQVAEIRERIEGKRSYPFGVPTLDRYEDGELRLTMGAAPGKVTVLTGLSGSGKSTLAAHIALGLARQRRRVLFGAWEPGEGMTLELLACFSCGMSRSALLGGKLSQDELTKLEKTMRSISQWVSFMANPFYRRDGGKASNERNLDLIEEHIAASRADVFIADLWERALETDDTGEEKRALFRQQAMCKDLGVHAILLAQQRKDVEQRADKRPTREGIKGSGAWFEVADTLLGTHRPAMWKRMEDNTLEVAVIKQRWGKGMLCVEFDWNPDRGSIENGRSVEYDPGGEANEFEPAKRPAMRPLHVKGKR